MKLLIVESPGKIKKISSYLGEEYIVEASYGHIRDLDPSNLSIDIENNFKPTYIISKDKVKQVNKLKKIKNDPECIEVILAADQDREGEAIAQSLKEVLSVKNKDNFVRITFNEITKSALLEALKTRGVINKCLVEAQQTRRFLDRIMGYKLSPLLWKNLPGTKSAGRVQSVLVKIIVDRENKIKDCNNELRVKMVGEFEKKLVCNLVEKEKNDIYYFKDLEEIKEIYNKLKKEDIYKIDSITITKNKRNPPPPFITSSLQQEASIKLRYNSKKTMMIAQQLYEGGYITYMRTDSTILSKEALYGCKKYVKDNYGERYYEYRQYKSRSKNAQEAHEAVRPTKIERDELSEKCSNEMRRLYKLIWRRTVASQMSSAEIEIQRIKIKCKNSVLRDYRFLTSLSRVVFDGYLKLYEDYDNENNKFKSLKEGEEIKMERLISSEDFKGLPVRFNESGLIKYLEEKGIGRPSTYASLISKILERGYVEIKDIEGEKREINILIYDGKISSEKKEISYGGEKKKLVPTIMGIKSNNFLLKYFDNIIEEGFTASLENDLDEISNGKLRWLDVMSSFYQNLKPRLDSVIVVDVENKDKLLMKLDGESIYYGVGKYGEYIKVYRDNNWKYVSVKNKDIDSLEKKEIKDLLEYPRYLGKKGNNMIYLCKGEYGYYIKMGKMNYKIDDIKDISLESAIEYIENPRDNDVIKTFSKKNKYIYLKKGKYGDYLQASIKGKKVNIKAPKSVDKLDYDDVLNYIKDKLENPVVYKKYKKG